MVLFHGVIGQVNEPVGKIFHVEFLACSTNVPILVPVPFHASVD
jgi:hypothetical protein